jgi:hypothetical protein
MAATDPWGNALDYDPERDEATDRLAELTDAELVELFGIPEEGWEKLIPPDKLALPTLGANRRAQGTLDEDTTNPFAPMLPEARVSFAFELVQEARRRAIADRLDGIYVGLSRRADPDNIGRRLRRLADQAVVER